MKLALSFPTPIKQIGPNTIEVQVKPFDGPFFYSEKTIPSLAPALSEAEQDRLAEDILLYAQSEAIRRAIRVSPIWQATTAKGE